MIKQEAAEMSERRIRNNKIRRRRERRKNILLFVMTVCFVISLFFSAGSILSNAKDHEEPVEYKYYASIPVESGDTLWSIAADHMGTHYDSPQEYIREVKQMNSLRNEDIQEGMYLIIPYYTTEFR